MTDAPDAQTCAQLLKWCDSIVKSDNPCAETARLIDLAREALETGRYELCVRLATAAADPAPPPMTRWLQR
jgi:hypothetical protein